MEGGRTAHYPHGSAHGPTSLVLTDPGRHRAVRSFVVRGGRITDAQERALARLWPSFGLEFEPIMLDLAARFGRAAPRTLEIGFGNGEHLVALAGRHPERDFLGIEVHRPGIGHLLLALEQHALSNVRVICHDAVEVLQWQLPAASLDEILILFPDPWPKKRHHKRRLVQSAFVQLIAERLRAGGRLHLATDWEPYAQQALEVLGANPSLVNLSDTGSFVAHPAERAPTRFERRGTRLGHQVFDLAFMRK